MSSEPQIAPVPRVLSGLLWAGGFLAAGLVIVVLPFLVAPPAQRDLLLGYDLKFMLWLVIVLTQFAVWGLATPGLLALIFDKVAWRPPQGSWLGSPVRWLERHLACYRTPRRRARPIEPVGSGMGREIGVCAVVFLVFVLGGVVFAVLKGPGAPFVPHYRVQIGLASAIGALVALLAGVGLWLTNDQVRAIARPAGDYTTDDIEVFLALRADLQACLYALGLILSGAVVGAAAQRSATLATPGHDPFGLDGVLLYGTYFTIVLAVAYLPVHATLLVVGKEIRDGMMPPMPAPTVAGAVNPDWEAWVTRYGSLGDLLELGVGANASLQAGVLILSPLLGALISFLFAAQQAPVPK
jgi:hypothetical protein